MSNKIISFENEKLRRDMRSPLPKEPPESSADARFKQEYNLVIRVTHENKIEATFQTYYLEVSEDEQIWHLERILSMLKKSNPDYNA